MNDTLLTALALIPALVIAIVFHEVAHGWTALMLGDPTAKERKRLTLNPLRHVDPFGTVLLPGALALAGAPVFGWAKPVPVNQQRLGNPRFGMMAVAAAGPGTNFVLAIIGTVAWGLLVGGQPAPEGVAGRLGVEALQFFILINVFPPSGDDAEATAFRAANAWPATASMRVKGTYDGQAFDVYLPVNGEVYNKLDPPFVVTADSKGSFNITIAESDPLKIRCLHHTLTVNPP